MGKDVSASRSIPLFWKIVTMHHNTPHSSARELVRTRREAGAFPQQYQKLLIKIPCSVVWLQAHAVSLDHLPISNK